MKSATDEHVKNAEKKKPPYAEMCSSVSGESHPGIAPGQR